LPFELPCARTLENSNQGKKEKEKRKKEIMCVIEAKLLGRQVIKCSQKPISCPLLSGGVLFFFFLITRVVRANLRASRLIPGSTEHPARSIDK